MSYKGEASPKQAKSIIIHPADFIDYMQLTMGVVNYQEDYNHFFLAAQRFITFVDQVNVALRRGIIGKVDYRLRNNPDFKQKTSLDPEMVMKIKSVWYGQCWIHLKRAKDYSIESWELVFTKKIRLQRGEELIYCPPLKAMNPVEPISGSTLGIMIRDYVPMKDAWWGHDYTQMVTSGGFNVRFSDGVKPLITSDQEVMDSDSLVNVVSREYFHKMIDILTVKWEEYNTELFLEMHEIISSAKKTGGYEDYGDNQVSMIVPEENN